MLKPVRSVFAMAAAGDVDSHDEEDGNRDDWGSCTIGSTTVQKIYVDKRVWFPETQEHDGKIYITLSKLDAALCLLVTGKAQNRHLKREAHDLNVVWWAETKQRSNSVPTKNIENVLGCKRRLGATCRALFWLAIFCKHALARVCILRK